MKIPSDIVHPQFERGIVILSIDTEQIWGYADFLSDSQFQNQFPDTLRMHEVLLARLCAARISATWFVVGGMALNGSAGSSDPRLAGLPADWIARIPAGT